MKKIIMFVFCVVMFSVLCCGHSTKVWNLTHDYIGVVPGCPEKVDSLPLKNMQDKDSFGFILKLGDWAYFYEINTIQQTYTCLDCVHDTTPVSLKFTKDEFGEIRKKVHEINFFSYPHSAPARDKRDEKRGGRADYISFADMIYFKVCDGGRSNEIEWKWRDRPQESQVDKVIELIALIEKIVFSKPEIRALL